jgi:hypothetical protein
MRWPFGLRRTADTYRLRLIAANERAAELGRALAFAQNELNRYKLLVGQNASGLAVLKKAVEVDRR